MCKGTGCPSANDCYRHRAIPNEYRQSYFANVPERNDAGLCSYYWPVADYPQNRLQSIKEIE